MKRMTKPMQDYNSHSSSLKIDRWMKTCDAANYVGTSPNNMRNWIYKGYLNPNKLMGRWFYRASELDRLIQMKGR